MPTVTVKDEEDPDAGLTPVEVWANNPSMFTFPPPPPPPPTTAQNYPAYSQAGTGQNYYGGRGNKGDRGHRGYGRGNGRGGQRGGGNAGSTYANSSQSGYPSVNSHRGSYPLPNYPRVQLPQYPANVPQEYGQRPAYFSPNASFPHPSQAAFPPHLQGSLQQAGGHNHYGPHGYGPSAPLTQLDPYAPQNPERFLHRNEAGHRQPVLMGPPLRLGFDSQGNDLQVPQSLQQNIANSYQNGTNNSNVSPLRHDIPLSIQSARHHSPGSFSGHRGQGQKRRHEAAFNRPRNPNPRPQAAPIVPSFGAPLPLPVKPPAPQEGPKNQRRKKKRKHNQLGLTPKTEEHESSEEEVEDDADEEARLAVAVKRGPQLLQFEYRGRTSTLQSSSDITAWIEERKKRFPTKTRAAENAELKRQHQEAQRAANLKRKEAQEKQKTEREEIQKAKREEAQMRKQTNLENNCEDAATKAKLKVEKLRKQLEREERRAAKAEAKASRNKLHGKTKGHEMGLSESHERMRPSSNESQNRQSAEAQIIKPEEAFPTDAITEPPVQAESFLESKQEASETADQNPALTRLGENEKAVVSIPDPLTPTSQPAAPDDRSEPPASTFELSHSSPVINLCKDPDRLDGEVRAIIGIEKASRSSGIPMSDSSPEISSTNSADITSTSGSSSSDAESDSPEQASTRRTGPERVPPPPRRKPKLICRDFLKSGRCKRGDKCKFRHELPERGSHNARDTGVPRVEKRKARIGLHQRLVEQEKEKEKEQDDNEILRAITHHGERGLLDHGATSEAVGK